MAKSNRRDPDGPKQTCPKVKQNGEPCRREAGYQTDHLGEGYCRQHGGMAPGQRANAARVIAGRVAEREARKSIAEEYAIDPSAALMWSVRLSAGAVMWYQKQLDSDYGLSRDQLEMSETERSKLKEMWHRLYGEERDRLVRASKAAIDAGIAERLVQMEEDQGRFVANAVLATLRRLGLPAHLQAQAPAILREELLKMPAPEPRRALQIASARAS